MSYIEILAERHQIESELKVFQGGKDSSDFGDLLHWFAKKGRKKALESLRQWLKTQPYSKQDASKISQVFDDVERRFPAYLGNLKDPVMHKIVLDLIKKPKSKLKIV